MRLLIIADIHANPWALDAVARDAGLVDHVVFAGDAVNYGPDPRRVIAWLRDHGAIAVRGNHDHAIAFGADPRASPAKQPLALMVRDWVHTEIDFGERMWLARLPLHLTWECHGMRMAMYHATPCNPLLDYRFVPTLPEPRVEEMVAGVDADVLVVGHTHLPFVRQCGRLSIVNPGSVGQPLDGDPRAAYALWRDGEISLLRIGYDVDAAVDAIDRMEWRPDCRTALIGMLRHGRVT